MTDDDDDTDDGTGGQRTDDDDGTGFGMDRGRTGDDDDDGGTDTTARTRRDGWTKDERRRRLWKLICLSIYVHPENSSKIALCKTSENIKNPAPFPPPNGIDF